MRNVWARTLAGMLVIGLVGSEAVAGGYGTKETVGTGTDAITLVKVGGTRYQMGYWYGRMLANEIAGCWTSLSAVLPFTEAQWNAAIAGMWNSAYFDTAAWESELNGIAAGCKDGGHSEITFATLRKMVLFADLSELGCSLFAAWGDATADGHLYQLRNLDWSMSTGIQNYPVVTIYEPDDGNVHAVIGFAGAIGAVGGGINEYGISESQIMGYFCDPESLNGIPFPVLLRDCLYHDSTLSEALTRIQGATRTNNYYYCISGPEGSGEEGRLLLTSGARCDIYADNQSVNPHPCVSPAPFHTSLNDVVYWTRHNGSRNQEFYNAINARYGAIDSAESIEIAQIIQDAGGGTLLSVIYDATAKEFWVAYANGTSPAPNQGFVHFDLSIPTGLTALDSYVAAPDSSYTWSLARTINGSGYKGYVLDLKSQTWRSSTEVNRTLWQHWLTVIKPTSATGPKAMLWINGGSNGGSAPTSVDSTLAAIATATNTVVADLRMVPNQPLTFILDETTPRTEDDLIAYTWDKFLRTGDETWPARLPMTKSAVRAMDATTAFCASTTGGSIAVNQFTVAGGSKRGWTTWTTAAVDSRVIAIAPIVIDVLNLERSMNHHHAAYGFWAPAVGDYVEMGIMEWVGTPEMAALMAIEDPYSYRSRFTIPKLVMNSTGDEFFLPDSSQFYFDDLPSEKHLYYVPNTSHGMSSPDAIIGLLSFYESVLAGATRPQYSWTNEGVDTIRVQTVTTPTSVKLWQATNANARDFRVESIGAAYTSTTLTDQGGGVYVGQVSAPPEGWRAFFVEMAFPGVGANPYRCSTAVRVIPDTLPFASDLDRDGDVDGFDFLTFSNCYNGSNRTPLEACVNELADLDSDGDTDGFDFLTFANCYNGSGRTPLCAP